MRIPFSPILLSLLLLAGCANPSRDQAAKAEQVTSQEWPVYGGNKAGNRYSPLTQINTQNVQQLQVAWTYNTGDNTGERGLEIQCHPIIVDGVLYGTSPRLKAFALKAGTGEMLWSFDPLKDKAPQLNANRGVTYWEDGDDKRILYTAGPNLYALNARTGEPVPGFGQNGEVSLHLGLGETLGRDVSKLFVVSTTPGVVYKDVLIMGTRVSENGDAAPGYIRGYDVRTGKIKWIFHTIPHPGEVGYETWPEDAYKRVGGANTWSGFTLDEQRGIVYMGTGSASFDFYGGNRHGENLFANCVLALNAETGERVWHFQTVHHDIWDRDLPTPPNLVTVTHNGKKRDAVAQATKSGFIFLLDRDTGEPLFPVEERPVPTEGAVAGEQPWPTQPFPLKPAPFARQVFREEDITDISPEAHAFVKEKWQKTRTGTPFIPPSLEGTIIFPGFDGGAEWGGNAVDPQGILYLNSNEMPWILTMVDVAARNAEITSKGKTLYLSNCASCHGPELQGDQHTYPSLVRVGDRLTKEQIQTVVNNGRGRMPGFQHLSDENRNTLVNFLLNLDPPATASAAKGPGAPPAPALLPDFPFVSPFTTTGYNRFVDQDGYPAVKPPWGTLNAIDLNTGEFVWRVPLGEFKELTAKGIPQTGTENYGGPIVTAGGLIFIGATKDEKFRAFDKKTGQVLWEYQLPAGGYATPSTYMVDGKQYVVIAAGGAKMGTKKGDAYIAFALP
jgi:quinoprotein glucose dehydrogenase